MNPWVKKKSSSWTSHPSVMDFKCWQVIVNLLIRMKTLTLGPEEQQRGEYHIRNRIAAKCMYNNFNFLIIRTVILITTSGLTIIQFLNFTYLKPFWLFIYLCICLPLVHFLFAHEKRFWVLTSWFLRVWFSLGALPWVTLVYWKEIQVKSRNQNKTKIKIISYYKNKRYKISIKIQAQQSNCWICTVNILFPPLHINPFILFSEYI